MNNNGIKSICFVLNLYPNEYRPRFGIFIKGLAECLADRGLSVTIIHPQPINLDRRLLNLPYRSIEITTRGSHITVYRPKTIGFGQQKHFGISPVKATTKFLEMAALKVIQRHSIEPDVFYGHFLAPSGVVVSRLSRRLMIPAICAFGESHPTIEQFGSGSARNELSVLKGGIAVSSYVRDYLTESNVIESDRLCIIPNGYSAELFHPIDKSLARQRLGLDPTKFIVGFVGNFSDRKGIRRLEAAVNQVTDTYLIAAGKGELQPKSHRCLWKDAILHEELNDFYNAMDVFALPTLKEGCANVIVEALGCGLPIISSDLAFNNEILNEECSFRIDPNSISELATVIEILKNDPKRREMMSRAALMKASELEINKRADRILAYISSVIKNN